MIKRVRSRDVRSAPFFAETAASFAEEHSRTVIIWTSRTEWSVVAVDVKLESVPVLEECGFIRCEGVRLKMRLRQGNLQQRAKS